MVIETMFLEDTEDSKFKTCPECGGNGKDNDTLDWQRCWLCDGIGKVLIDE